MKFHEVFFKGGVLSVLRILIGFITIKFIAVFGGAAAMANVGQLQSFLQIIYGLTANQLSQGTGRYTAENYNGDIESVSMWWKGTTTLILLISLALAVPLILFSNEISIWLFNTEENYWLIILIACVLPLSSINLVLINVLNSLGLYAASLRINLISIIITSSLSLLSIYFFGITGLLVATIFLNLVVGAFSILYLYGQPWLKVRAWFGKTTKETKVKLASYILIGFFSAITGPVVMILIRNIITAEVGIDITGTWQALNRLSGIYYTVITLGVSMYYFPKVAKIKTKIDVLKETYLVAKIYIPLVILSLLFLYFIRSYIVSILLTNEFRSLVDVYSVQLLGDFFRVIAFIPACIMLANGYFKRFIFGEVIMNVSLLFLTKNYIVSLGLEGVVWSYMVSYILYFIYSLFVFKSHYRALN